MAYEFGHQNDDVICDLWSFHDISKVRRCTWTRAKAPTPIS